MTRGFQDDDARGYRADLVDIAATLRRETPLAWCIFDGAREVWVPKSQVEKNPDGTWTMRERMAIEKGLL